LAKVGVLKRQFNVGFQIADAVSRIVRLPVEVKTNQGTLLAKQVQSIRKLNLSSRVRLGLSNCIPDGGL
jgi:hypothetical protein